jgi:hypothetical protein
MDLKDIELNNSYKSTFWNGTVYLFQGHDLEPVKIPWTPEAWS